MTDEPLDPAQFPTGSAWQAVRSIATALAPSLAATPSKMAAVLILRDQVYWRVALGPTPSGYSPWMTPDVAYRDNVRDQLYTHECGGRCLLFLIACRAFGIRARYVGLWDGVVNINSDTAFVHASSEILIGGRWIVCDGHYNITLRDQKGWRLSWMDARERLLRNEPVTFSTDGYTQGSITPEHYLNDVYHETLTDLTSFIATSVHRDRKLSYPAAANTPGWTGMLSYIGGATYDAVASINGDPYAMLAQP
ncbi:transglutaminase domain-containing protein [Bradyrhizobium sp. AUGA SZCCT0160]|uniref:transglutaminase domain-containing protein n=1 Tax=Bradyrhizobium sp. AUGA SZCCT0160 TaxID=2807662 RepID=UPI001BA7FC27|nr:transglutaminase domain-containing protein [Bradyrhizobium sp. AUGA SZCCT0160]MBR1193247.1 hypothetical protein [Bradyrhizobium sp. AUGA SZCCT0160]